ncbi:hypothetical protein ACHAWF_001391, partial [Thalassiosira exigua]
MLSLNEEDTTAAEDRTPQLPPPTEANGPLVTAAGMAGKFSSGALKAYDFTLFGFFSDVIPEVFFPLDGSGNNGMGYGGDLSHGNLVNSFTVYGLRGRVPHAARGRHRPRLLRRQVREEGDPRPVALPDGGATTLMGFLPTYEQVGSWSTSLLVLCRLLKGMSVGGQLPTSLVYTVETRPREHWGYYASLVMMAANVGTLLGNPVGAVIRTVLTDSQLLSYGCRIAFWTGLLNALVLIFLS